MADQMEIIRNKYINKEGKGEVLRNEGVMKVVRKEVSMDVPNKGSLFSIDKQVQDFIKESGVTDGMIFINCVCDASIFIDLWPPDEWGEKASYYLGRLFEIVPPYEKDEEDEAYCSEGVMMDKIIRRQILGKDVTLSITKGKIDFGEKTLDTLCYFDPSAIYEPKAHFMMKIIGV